MLNVTAFLSYVIVSNISPGPNAIISMSNASRYPLKKSLQFNIGIASGVFCVLLLCSIFSLTVYKIFPALQPIMIWIGAGYILFLAWKTLKSSSEAHGEDASGEKKDHLFFQGAALQFINPNTILYGISVFTTFIVPYYKSPIIIVLFCILLSLAALIATACWTLFGTIFRKFLTKYSKAINLILALLLAYCAISLIL